MVLLILQQALPFLRAYVTGNVEVLFVAFVAVSVGCGVMFSAVVEKPLLHRMRRQKVSPARSSR
jgi:peptidoglycan/LPS O-acetylase OafA/YrhL